MKRSLLLAVFAPVLLAGSLSAAADFFLELDGIKGESSDERHAGTIEIESFSWGASNPDGSATGGGTGNVSFQDMTVTTKISKASPVLMLHCADGKHIAKAKLFVRKSGGDQQEYYTIVLEDVYITSVKQTGRTSTASTSDDRPTEEVAFYYNKISVAHTADDGTLTTGEAVRPPVQPSGNSLLP